MSLYYEQLLIPASPQFRPTSAAVAEFSEKMVADSRVASPATIQLDRLTRVEPVARRMPNPFGMRQLVMYTPSRRIQARVSLSAASEIRSVAGDESEYDVTIQAEGRPRNPSCVIGYAESDEWKPFDGPYHHEICCHVRSSVVRLSQIRSEEDLQPMKADMTELRPYTGEDCSAHEGEGLFVHPETGAIKIAGAGCATFWISFRFGKSLYPRANHGRVDVLDHGVVDTAERTLGTPFLQACSWE